jgi:aminopeptidase-like protein
MSSIDELKVIEGLFDDLYPLCRSITGEGLRKSFNILKKHIPLELLHFETGEQVLNWTVPREWLIRDAWIKDEFGNKVVDFKESNLHVINYTIGIHKKVDLKTLKEHIHTLPQLPEAIPYVTSYYKERWGFCMQYEKYEKLQEGIYEVFIDSELKDGTLEVGHTILEGNTNKEVLLSAYLCHPSMANNELSGPIVLAMLYNRIKKWDNRNLTYRFVVNPETIGSIAYLSRYGKELKDKMHSGLVLTCLGGNALLRYKMSRKENAPIDGLISYLVNTKVIDARKWGFTPLNGSDERQYCSPGFNLPVGQIARLVYGDYPEYHTSLDTKELMGIDNILKSVDELETILMLLDKNGYYINTKPYGEVKLGDYDLYPTLNSEKSRVVSTDSRLDSRQMLDSILMLLSYSDGNYSLIDIAAKLGYNVDNLIPVVELLKQKGLLEGPYFIKGEKTL